MKWFIGGGAILFAIYAAGQAIVIIQAGVTNQIPQLIGDGGGGMVFAALCFAAGVVCLFKPVVSVPLFGLCMLSGILTGFVYDDPTMWIWSAATFVLGGVSYAWHRWRKRTGKKIDAKVARRRHASPASDAQSVRT